MLNKAIKELEGRLNALGMESSVKNGEFEGMRKQFERQIAEKNL